MLIFTLVMVMTGTLEGLPQTPGQPVIRISPEGGFTLSPVREISQDKYGFIWFITREKLFQYNTRDFMGFDPRFPDHISHTNNYINSLLIDHLDRIWIGTNGGINLFDRHLQRLVPVTVTDTEFPGRVMNIIDIQQNVKGEIWILESANLARLDTAGMKLAYVKQNETRLSVNAFCFDREGNLYTANNNGEMFRIQSPTLRPERLLPGMTLTKVHGIYLIDSLLYVSTDGYGFSRYSTSGLRVDSWFGPGTIKNEMTSDRIRDIIKTADGKIWIATFKGLLQWSPGVVTRFLPDIDNPATLPDNSVVSLFEDRQKGLWIGTWRGGLAYINRYANSFDIYRHSPYKNSISGNLINTINQDKNGIIWLGSDGNGLNMFDEALGVFTQIPLIEPDGNEITNVKCVLPENSGEVWIGTFRGGVFHRSADGKILKQVLLNGENVYDLSRDREGVWIATFGRGLYYYELNTGTLKHYGANINDPSSLASNYIREITADRKNNLWINTNAGICIKPSGKEVFERLNIENGSNPDAMQVYTVCDGNNGHIWLGTDAGLVSVNDSTRTSEHYPLYFNGKPVSVYGIVCLSPEQLWLSSNYGIFSYNPLSHAYLNYSTVDGLPGNLFNAGAVFRSASGRVYFGATSGLVAFHPGMIQVNPYVPDVYFSRIFINHREVLPEEKDSPLDGPLYDISGLKLKPAQKAFSIEFVALNYLNPAKNQFKYRLKGFDDAWVNAGNNNWATYTNIPPGNYLFEVLASNNDMAWTQQPATLEISIPPPVWRSNLAILAYILFILSLALLARRIILNRAKLKKQIEIERIQRQEEEKSHQERITFFTNISHELRTPLTLISSPLDMLMQSPDLDQDKYNLLSLIKRNSNRLLNLINQLLEFRRVETGKAELSVCEADLVAYVHGIFDFFQDSAGQKRIDYVFVPLFEKIVTTFDPDVIDKAVFNLLSNAFKYTPEKGNIQVEITKGLKENEKTCPTSWKSGELLGDKYVQISVMDSGPGLESHHLEKIFDRFYKAGAYPFEQVGTGIGLHLARRLILMHGGEIGVISSPGKGSIFHIRIPYGNGYLKQLESENGVVIKQLPSLTLPGYRISGDSDDKASMKENWDKADSQQKKPDKLILVVEDHLDIRILITQILSDKYRIIACGNGMEGLEKARIFLPDLIISDILMPGMNGMDLVKELKTDISTCHIPVILLTAVVSDEYKITGYDTGADDYIEKPFSPDVLKSRVRNLLGKIESLQQYYMGRIAQGFDMDAADSPDQKLLMKAVRFVENNLTDDNLGIESLTNHLSLSRSTLHRKIKALTGKPATDFIRTIKLEYAARLMKNGNDNIEQVSELSGFHSHSYFTRSFKEHFGKTPTEFLTSHLV